MPVLAVSMRHPVSGESRATFFPFCFYADGLLLLEQYLGDASLGHDGQIRRAGRKVSP